MGHPVLGKYSRIEIKKCVPELARVLRVQPPIVVAGLHTPSDGIGYPTKEP